MNILGEIVYIYTPMMIIFNTVVIENIVTKTSENNFISSIIFFILVFVYFFSYNSIIHYEVVSR
jgi:hypothetical protein